MKSNLLFGTTIRLAAPLLLLGFSTLQLAAQDEENPNIYTGASSAILRKDGTEINIFNNISSFWLAQNEFDGSIEATRIVNRYRYSRADHILRVSRGFSKSGRWDLGADIAYTRIRYDDEARSSPFRVYNNAYDSGETHSGVSYLGVQTRVMPFPNVPELTLRAGYGFPVARTEEQRLNLNAQRSLLYLGALFSERIGQNLIAQAQSDFRTYFRNSENDRTLIVPSLSGNFLFEIGEHWYILSGLSYYITFQQSFKGASFLLANQQMYGSLGVIYRPNSIFNLVLSGQLPFIFESGSSHSIWVRESYFGLNLGFRFIF